MPSLLGRLLAVFLIVRACWRRGDRKAQPRIDAMNMVNTTDRRNVVFAEPVDPLSLAALAVYARSKEVMAIAGEHPGMAFVSLLGKGKTFGLDLIGADVEISYELPFIHRAA